MASHEWRIRRKGQLLAGTLMMFGLAGAISAQQDVTTDEQQRRMHEEIARNVIRWQPVMWSGEFVGFRIYPGQARESFFCLGLKPGDLVSEIDGAPLDEIGSAPEVFYRVATRPVVLKISRENGPPKRIATSVCKSTA